MLKEEFEKLVERTVTDAQYKEIEKWYYQADTLSKKEFANVVKPFINMLYPVQEKKEIILGWIAVEISRVNKPCTIQGTYDEVVVQYYKVIDTDIASGKCIVKKDFDDVIATTQCKADFPRYWFMNQKNNAELVSKKEFRKCFKVC